MGELFHGVPGGIHGDHYHLGILDLGTLQRRHELIQERHGRGADIRAVGEAEEYQAPLALEARPGKGLAVMINQAYFAEITRRLQQIKPVCLHFGRRHYPRLLDSVDEAADDHRDKD